MLRHLYGRWRIAWSFHRHEFLLDSVISLIILFKWMFPIKSSIENRADPISWIVLSNQVLTDYFYRANKINCKLFSILFVIECSEEHGAVIGSILYDTMYIRTAYVITFSYLYTFQMVLRIKPIKIFKQHKSSKGG